MSDGWIDSHIHLFEHGHRGDRSSGAELIDYDRLRCSYGISHALVVGYEGVDEHVGNNAHLARLAAEHDWILPLRYVHPAQGLHPADDIAEARWTGVSLYLVDEAATTAWLSWSHQDWSLLPPGSLISVNTTQDRLPAVAAVADRIEHPLLISHLATPAPPDADVTTALAALTSLATHPRVHVKLSGHWAMIRRGWQPDQLAESTRLVVDAFGVDRVHWGSDFSPCLEHHDFATAAHPAGLADLPDEIVTTVRGSSLADLLDLSDHPPYGDR